MPEETKPITEVKEVKAKPSSRELALEDALKNAIVVVENLNLIIQRMGVKSLGSVEWVEETKKLLSVPK